MGSELECKAKVLFANVSFIFTRGGGGGSWVFLGWVCAARATKLAPRSK